MANSEITSILETNDVLKVNSGRFSLFTLNKVDNLKDFLGDPEESSEIVDILDNFNLNQYESESESECKNEECGEILKILQTAEREVQCQNNQNNNVNIPGNYSGSPVRKYGSPPKRVINLAGRVLTNNNTSTMSNCSLEQSSIYLNNANTNTTNNSNSAVENKIGNTPERVRIDMFKRIASNKECTLRLLLN
jgi:hypothetical protein